MRRFPSATAMYETRTGHHTQPTNNNNSNNNSTATTATTATGTFYTPQQQRTTARMLRAPASSSAVMDNSAFKHLPDPHDNRTSITADGQSTPITPVKPRTLFSRLFRMRSRDATPSPVTTVTNYYTKTGEEKKKPSDQEQHQQLRQAKSTSNASMPVVLMEGYLTKLSTHKYWHSKPSYFVLLELNETPTKVAVHLRQYRRQEDARIVTRPDLVVSHIVLADDDVVIDISDRYIKFGLELLYTIPEETFEVGMWPSQSSFSSSSGQNTMHSLRLTCVNANLHDQWMRALGSAIAKLIFQSKKHYPIDSTFEHTRLISESNLSTKLSSSSNSSSSAKVTPLLGNHVDIDTEEVREAQQQEAEEKEMAHSMQSFGSISLSSTPEEEDNFNGNAGGNESDGTDNDNNNDRERDNQEDNQVEINEEEEEKVRRKLEELDCSVSPGESVSSSESPYAGSSSTVNPTARFLSSPNESVPATSSTANSSVSSYQSKATPAQSSATIDARKATSAPAVTATSATTTSSASTYLRPRFARSTTTPLYPPVRPQMHSFNANGQVFTLDVRYRLLKSIGNGAYGAVIAAQDTINEANVAVKKITNIFEDLVDAKRILREVRLLRHFDHKNITNLLDLSPPPSKKHFDDVYIITELMETDLHQVIYSMQPMSDDHVKYFLYQMLCALYHIHSAGVLHRDMKPSNILLNSNCDLKICDFGLARGGVFPDQRPQELTEYVVTRWYRAPEIMLNCLHYTEAIDIWAVGCIFAEMLLREPLFPGNDYIHQLKLIIKFLGTPKQEDIGFVKNAKALRFLTKLAISKPKKWKEVFAGEDINPLAIDLLSQMLIFNPEKRISVEKALQHPYLSTFYDSADITTSPKFDFTFDLPDEQLTKDLLIDLLVEDIEHFHPVGLYAPPPAAASFGSRFFNMGMTASAS